MNVSEFQQKISETSKPVIVDFWAGWCVPCMMTKPILEKLAKEYADRVEFIPINADDSPEVLKQFHVFGIPTVLTFHNGKAVGRVTGAQNEINYRIMFEALSEGRDIKVPPTQIDRILRLGAGAVFIMVGISSHNWMLGGIGSAIVFMGVYDRCPFWRAVTGILKRN